VTRGQKLAVMGLGYVGMPESGCPMSGVPLDPPKDYGDIPPPCICCFPREREGIGEADKPLVYTENPIRVDDVMESPKLAE